MHRNNKASCRIRNQMSDIAISTNTMINTITIMIRKYCVDITNIDDLMDQLINLFLGTNNTIL